jgi:hypothetical protein
LFLIYYLQVLKGYSPLMCGLLFLPTVTSSYARGVLPAMLVLGLGFGTIAATHGYTLAFAVAAALLGLGVILAVVLLPSRCRLEELRNAAPASAPAPQPERQAIPVALVCCSPVTHPVPGRPSAANR